MHHQHRHVQLVDDVVAHAAQPNKAHEGPADTPAAAAAAGIAQEA
jgi:hypothetical protein